MSPNGWYGLICCICFEHMEPEDCYVDTAGKRWDFHPGLCAVQALGLPPDFHLEVSHEGTGDQG